MRRFRAHAPFASITYLVKIFAAEQKPFNNRKQKLDEEYIRKDEGKGRNGESHQISFYLCTTEACTRRCR